MSQNPYRSSIGSAEAKPELAGPIPIPVAGCPMTTQQLFGVLARAIGLYWLTDGLSLLFNAIVPPEGYSNIGYAALGGLHMILGLFLMFKADPIVGACYRKFDSDGYPES